MSNSLQLRCELHGHQEDVRGVCVTEAGLLTSSRDRTIKLWVEESVTSFHVLLTLVGHKDYVGPLLYIAPALSQDYPQGAFVSGSRDSTIIVWDMVSASPLATLTGHTYQVTALGLLPSGEIVSSALDKTVKIWRGGKEVASLEGHAGPVLCLAVTPDGAILSGSGDNHVLMWRDKRAVLKYSGHTDTVRAMAVLPDGSGFVTGSHDTSVRVWDMHGAMKGVLLGHTALVYAVAVAPGGKTIASGSEDNTVRTWDIPSGECRQVIQHPGCVWALTWTPEGDLVSGCGDAVARIFSADPARQGDAQTKAAFEKLVAERTKPSESAGVAAAPGQPAGLPPGLKVVPKSVLSRPGAKDGEVACVMEDDGSVAAHSWDGAHGVWERIGEVVAGPGGGGQGGTVKKAYGGRQWDYVFDVAMEDGSPSLKLAMNADENPYLVAARFLEENDLPLSFKDQVVQFIMQNTAQQAAPMLNDAPVTGGFCDPFTGGSSSEPSYPPVRAPPPQPTTFSVTGGGVDPFTGTQATASSTTRGHSGLTHAPQASFIIFDNLPPAGVLARKVRELNAGMGAAGLDAGELQEGGALDQLIGALSTSPPGPLTPEQVALLSRLLAWKQAALLPGLDLTRLALLAPAAAAEKLLALAGDFNSPEPGTIAAAIVTAFGDPPLAPIQTTAARLAANLFRHPPMASWALAQRGGLLDALASASTSGTKSVRAGVATALSNFALALRGSSGDQSESQLQVLSALVTLAQTCPPLEDPESLFRSLVGIATLLVGANRDLVGVALDLGLTDTLRNVQNTPGVERRLLEAAVDNMTCISAAK